jgi:hypothetical protein
VLDGLVTLDSPWLLRVFFADDAGLTDIPNVDAPAPTNGQVLGWDSTLEQWTPRAASIAPPGAVLTGNGVDGDGSGGDPLVAVGNAARYISVTASGIGLSDAGLNALIRPFANEAARDAASPAVVEGTISILTSDPDRLEWYDGTDWHPITGGHGFDVQGGEFLDLSGSYDGGKVTDYIAQLDVITDSTGAFEVIPAADLSGYSGVLHVSVQETGDVAWHCQVKAGANNVTGVARRIDTGAAYPGAAVTGMVRAALY